MYKVLLVEDEKAIRKGLAFTVDWDALGCAAPLEAANGREGLALIRKKKPDIVLTDVRMPYMDGIKMLEKGLEGHSFESAILSGFDEFAYAQSALRLGVSAYLLKPVKMDELRDTVQRLCARVEKGRLLRHVEGMMPESPARQVLDLRDVDLRIKTSSRHVAAMLQRVRDGYMQKLNLKTVAEEIGISPTYLNTKFKEEVGHTFNDFLNRYRIQQAIGLLLHGGCKIYEAGELAGYSEYRYFAAVFKKYVGCTPTEFMQNHKEGTGHDKADSE